MEGSMGGCKKTGMKVFIDIHGIAPDSYTVPLWGNPEYLYSALEWFVTQFANDDKPHQQGQGCSTGPGTCTIRKSSEYVAGQTGKRILAKHSRLLIVVEGNHRWSRCHSNVHWE
jgi:hypothetical protein